MRNVDVYKNVVTGKLYGVLGVLDNGAKYRVRPVKKGSSPLKVWNATRFFRAEELVAANLTAISEI